MEDDSLISPSTYWGGRNNVMSEIPAWEVQKTILDQVRTLESQGLVAEAGPKKKRYKLPSGHQAKPVPANQLDEHDYRKAGVKEYSPGELVGLDGVACNCYLGPKGWRYATQTNQPCSCHENPESIGYTEESNEMDK
jgi:hypothetical protein